MVWWWILQWLISARISNKTETESPLLHMLSAKTLFPF